MTPWTLAHQAPLSMISSRQGYWSGQPFPSLGDLPLLEIKPAPPAWPGGFFTAEPPEKLLRREQCMDKCLLKEEKTLKIDRM